MNNQSLLDYTLHLADANLVLAQRNGEWCAHGPILEQDIAITNISLDLLGQARNFYQYAAELINQVQQNPVDPYDAHRDQITDSSYDAAHRKTSESQTLNSQNPQTGQWSTSQITTGYGYDANGNVTRVENGLQQVTQSRYNASGQVTESITAAGVHSQATARAG